MKWAIAVNMMGIGLVLLLAGMALRRWTEYRDLGSILKGVGIGVLVTALMDPWFTN
jgi:hypothetical protein